MNQRSRVVLALVVGLGVGSACSLYVPTMKDCSLKCSEDGKCPDGTTCNEGYCRPAGFSGACDCNAGDTESCGTQKGECRPGQRICLDTRIWGPCLGEVKPTFELCDGKDNDCDGTVDEEVANAPVCPLMQGVCERKTQQCIDAGFVDTCGPAAYGPDYEVLEQTCDGKDNDCDGNVDSRAATRLAAGVNRWTAEAVPGGYFLFSATTGSSIVTVRQYNDVLQLQGTPATVDVGGAAISDFRGRASNAGTVAVGFVRTDNTVGVIRLSTSAPIPMQLDNPISSSTADWAISVLPTGSVRGAFERDGGVMMATWDPVTTAVTISPRTLRAPVTKVSSLSLTADGTVLAWDGDYDDGGTSESTGAVELIEGSQVTRRTGGSYGKLVVTPGQLQSFRSFYNYFPLAFPIAINESGVIYCSDLWSLTDTCVTVFRNQDWQQVAGGTATRLGDDMIVGWMDSKQLVVGRALPSVQQVRQRTLSMTGQVANFELAAPPGSNFITVFYVPLSDATSVYAMLLCPP